MYEQVFGIFDSLENTKRAISALKDHGATEAEVSVIQRHDGRGIPVVENAADHEISATGPGDVVAGAVKGGAAGLALGILASVIALSVPGIGPVLAAGPIAAALGSTAIATAAGAVGGGVVGYLVDQGVPEEAAIRYSDHLGRGDILVGVRSAHFSAADAEMLLQKYGAIATSRHAVGTPLAPEEPRVIDEIDEAHVQPVAAVRPVAVD